MENKKKTLLITGAGGFVGKNLVAQLRNEGWNDLLLFDVDTPKELLADYAARADFVFHLAGVNRPQNPDEFYEGNRGFTEHLLALLAAEGNKAPVLVTSSIQAELGAPSEIINIVIGTIIFFIAMSGAFKMLADYLEKRRGRTDAE